MTCFSNHSMGLEVASSLTLVGLTRASTGPAMSVRLSGCSGWLPCAMTDAATSADGHGWHTDSRCIGSPMDSMKRMTWLTYSLKPNDPASSGVSRALCQSVMYTSWSASSVRTVGRSNVAKWPDNGATTSTFGCTRSARFSKCNNEPNGVWSAVLSCTFSSTPSTMTVSMPNAGRWCERCVSSVSCNAARTDRTGSRSATAGGSCSSSARPKLAETRTRSAASVTG
jgi:hypothetical protein